MGISGQALCTQALSIAHLYLFCHPSLSPESLNTWKDPIAAPIKKNPPIPLKALPLQKGALTTLGLIRIYCLSVCLSVHLLLQ